MDDNLFIICSSFLIHGLLFIKILHDVLSRRKSKVRRKSRYKMLEGDDQETLELQLPRPGNKYSFEDNYSTIFYLFTRNIIH